MLTSILFYIYKVLWNKFFKAITGEGSYELDFSLNPSATGIFLFF